MSEFKAGDVISLKSGGPAMTVSGAFDQDDGQKCVRAAWYAESRGEFEYEDFFVEMVCKQDELTVRVSIDPIHVKFPDALTNDRQA